MNSFKVVTVCYSDPDPFNAWKKSFIPDRKNLRKPTISILSKEQPRRESPYFSSMLRPVTYSQMAENFPVLMKPKPRILMNRNGSVDSEVLRNEINTAVLLLESRNERDMLPQNTDQHNSAKTLAKNCHYKIHDRNQLTKSAQNTIERRFQSNVPRWKSAKTSLKVNDDQTSKKCHLRMLSAKVIPTIKIEKCIPKMSSNAFQDSSDFDEKRPNLIVSPANSLTNFITIDDISGVKDSWFYRTQNPTIVEEVIDTKPTINLHVDNKTQLPHKRREDVLREYMDVYMHWRTINAIEERHRLTSGKYQNCKSANIRTATPKQRIEQFQKIVNEKKDSVRKKIFAHSNRTVEREASPINVTVESENDDQNLSYINKNLENLNTECIEDIDTNDAKVNVVFRRKEVEEDAKSDTYSEIDWLECEDIN